MFSPSFDILQTCQPDGTFLNKASFSKQASDKHKELLRSLPAEIDRYRLMGARHVCIVQYDDKEIHACPDFNIIRPIVDDDVRGAHRIPKISTC